MSIKKIIEVEAKVDKAEKDLKGIQDSVKRIDENLEDVKDTTGGVAKGVKGIGNALKAAGIGLAIAAFSKLAEVFNQNQKVTDAFNTAFEALSLAFNDFFKFLDANVGTVIGYFKGIFSDPQQALKDLGNAIKDNLIERFNSALEVIGYLGTAIKKVFEGDFDGAMEAAKNAGKEYVDVLTGVDDSVDKIVEGTKKVTSSITEYAKSTIKAAQSTVELNKQAEVAAVINQGLIEKYDRQAEQQRQIRDDETKTIEERIAANNKLGEVLEEQQKLMLENVDITIRAAQAEYDKNKNQENYIALLEAQNEREAVLAQIEGFRSEQKQNLNSLNKEALELQNEAIETENERIAKIAELTNFEILTAVEKLQRDRDNALAELDLLKATEEEKQKIRDHYAKEEEKLNEQKAAEQKQLDRDVADAKLGAASNAFALIGELAGEGSKLAKTAAIAQATVAGIQSTVNAFQTGAASPITTVFPAYPFVQAGLAAGFAALNVAKIKSTNMSSGGGGGSAQPSAPAAPSFNVVGASDTNQLAQAIGQKEETPVKAYVVSNEVSNAQALDRNIVEGAAIG